MADRSRTEWSSRWEEQIGLEPRAIQPESTSVILLKWGPGLDDLNVEDEVQRLHDVFKNKYGFEVYNKSITHSDGVKAQQQAQSLLSNFVMEQDKKHGLLIIYYAGHGYSDFKTDAGDINMVGSLTPNQSKDAEAITPNQAKDAEAKSLESSGIVWSQVEATIKRTHSDILLIFDCCHAGRLSYLMRGMMSTYEFLGACQAEERTRGPGPHSFTHALTAVLEDFAPKKSFTTAELWKAIKDYPDLPVGQDPVLTFRRLGTEHIVLCSKFLDQPQASSTLTKAERAQERIKELRNKQYIDLRFWPGEDLQFAHLDATALALKPLMKSKKLWERIELIDENSIIAQKTLKQWKAVAFSDTKKRRQSLAPPQTPLTSEALASAVVDLTLTIPKGASASPVSDAVPGPSPDQFRFTSTKIHSSHVAQADIDDQSITYHMSEIARKLLQIVQYTLKRVLDKVSFRPKSSYSIVLGCDESQESVEPSIRGCLGDQNP